MSHRGRTFLVEISDKLYSKLKRLHDYQQPINASTGPYFCQVHTSCLCRPRKRHSSRNLDKRRPISYTLLTVKKVVIYTDGACSGNPGPGGWGAILISGTRRKEISGGERQTTNNRMELSAAIEALKILKESAVVDLFTDSTYLKRGMTEWLPTWKKNDWKRKSGKRLLPVKNKELWHELDRLVGRHRVTFHWVEGHAGHAENERCDRLARQAIPSQ